MSTSDSSISSIPIRESISNLEEEGAGNGISGPSESTIIEVSDIEDESSSDIASDSSEGNAPCLPLLGDRVVRFLPSIGLGFGFVSRILVRELFDEGDYNRAEMISDCIGLIEVAFAIVLVFRNQTNRE